MFLYGAQANGLSGMKQAVLRSREFMQSKRTIFFLYRSLSMCC